jgi:hypothetical protein
MTAYVKIPVDEYNALVQAASQPPPTRASGARGNALAAAVAAITARQAGIQLSPDADPERIIHYLALIAAALLEGTTSDRGASLLSDLGLEATNPHWNRQ